MTAPEAHGPPFRKSDRAALVRPHAPSRTARPITQSLLSPPSLISAGDIGLDGPMERVEAELFTDGGNDAVVRLLGRRFPGVLVQGDSLHILRSEVADVV